MMTVQKFATAKPAPSSKHCSPAVQGSCKARCARNAEANGWGLP